METDRSGRQHTAFARLAAVAAILTVLCVFACRPDWSPDGKQLLFVGGDQNGAFVATYDREMGKAERLLALPAEDVVAKAMWTPDGKRAVVVSGGGVAGLRVRVADVPLVGEPLVHKVPAKIHLGEGNLVMASAVVGGHLFLTAEDILRVDLKTGETKRIKAKQPGARLVVVSRGAGVCCIESKIDRGQVLSWELTSLDTDTLKHRVLLSSKDFPDLECTPLPTFSGDLERIALTSSSRHEVYVFRDGKLEATLPFGAKGTVQTEDIVMPKDGATVFATVCRKFGKDRFAWSFVEGTIGGAIIRERRLFASGSVPGAETPGVFPGVSLGLSVSPDQRVAAMTTCMTTEVDLRPQDEGLYLVDLVGGQRTVTKVPFPAARDVK
jgi:hypothetical protein